MSRAARRDHPFWWKAVRRNPHRNNTPIWKDTRTPCGAPLSPEVNKSLPEEYIHSHILLFPIMVNKCID